VQLWQIQTDGIPMVKEWSVKWRDANVSAVTVYAPDALQSSTVKVILGYNSGAIVLWKSNGTNEVFEGHKTSISHLERHNDELASASSDGVVNLWNLKTGSLTYSFHPHKAPIQHLAFDDQVIITACISEQALVTWPRVKSNLMWIASHNLLRQPPMTLRDIVFHENKLVGCEDRIITIWDPYTYYVYQAISRTNDDIYLRAAFNGNAAITALCYSQTDAQYKLFLWDFTEEEILIPGLPAKDGTGVYVDNHLSCISGQKKFKHFSFEELRWGYYKDSPPDYEEIKRINEEMQYLDEEDDVEGQANSSDDEWLPKRARKKQKKK